MRTILTTIVAILLSGVVWGQSLINESRMFINPVNLHEYDKNESTKLSANTKRLGKKYRFTIVGEEEDFYRIYLWNWEEGSDKYNEFNYNKNSNEQRFFLIKKNEIDIQSRKIYNRWSAEMGALAFPFKYRPNDGSFEPTFSLNLTAGATFNPWRTNEHTFSVLLGVGPSSAKVNNYNINNKDEVIDGDLYLAAVTFSLNLVYTYDFAQFGISVGLDNLMDNRKYDWKNQGKPWFSFGVGVDIFKSNKTATPTDNNNN